MTVSAEVDSTLTKVRIAWFATIAAEIPVERSSERGKYGYRM